MNGDECDWLCRTGSGEPLPDPDPSVSDYVPVGDWSPVGPTGPGILSPREITAAWTGTELAVVYAEDPDADGPEPVRYVFRRIDREGRPVGPEWTYAPPHPELGPVGGHDLVWHGDGFGLFFDQSGQGIWFIELDHEGKPLGEPVSIVSDSRAFSPAADLSGDRYVLAWIVEVSMPIPRLCAEPPRYRGPDPIRMRMIGRDGARLGLPVEVEPSGAAAVDVAAGPGGFGLTLVVDLRTDPADWDRCGFLRFGRVNETLTDQRYSGILDRVIEGQVRLFGDRYLTAWTGDLLLPDEDAICLARFTAAGELEDAPACNPLGPDMRAGSVRLAGGDGGALIVFASGPTSDTDDRVQLRALRTDARGVAVGPAHEIMPLGYADVGHFAVVWAGNAFAVLRVDFDEGMLLRWVEPP